MLLSNINSLPLPLRLPLSLSCYLCQGKKGDLDKAYRVDKELAAAEAKRLIAMEKRQEDDAYLLSREYDDDYDDQVCACDWSV